MINALKKTEKNYNRDFFSVGLSIVFLVIVLTYSLNAFENIPNNIFIAIAALFGAYMSMNIGANDVANNVGPAVGAKALTMFGAIIIASIFEASGALIAGGEVVNTIKKGIIDPAMFSDVNQFVWAMTASLLAAALWLNTATYIGAPVSTTHSIVGGVMGGGIAAAGTSIVSWGTVGKIAASWVISPILGGVIAAIFLLTIKKSMIYQKFKTEAAQKMVPIYIAIMSWAFITYLLLKGLKRLIQLDFLTIAGISLIASLLIYIIVKPIIAKTSIKLENSRAGVNSLFTIPLIFAAALLSFAHGANDVANAIGPLAAVVDAVMSGGISKSAHIPLWVMLIGAVGISLGLALYGPKLIKTVGSEITELDQVRAFSIAMAASITVIVASQLGLPVSSTHIAIGGVFGVGFLREYLYNSKEEEKIRQEKRAYRDDKMALSAYINEKSTIELKPEKTKQDYEKIVELFKLIEIEEDILKQDIKAIKSTEKVKLVKRDALTKIVAAWVITLPASAVLSALIFFMIKGMVS